LPQFKSTTGAEPPTMLPMRLGTENGGAGISPGRAAALDQEEAIGIAGDEFV
jgi:hypothetical protein